jgi:hypothetical protein
MKPRSAADILERVFASAPNGRTAATVTSASADQYESPVKPGGLHWDAQPRTRAPNARDASLHGFEDMTGRRFGRMTVIGLASERAYGSKVKGCWVVRCACGHYESRRAKAIRNPANADDACVHCRHVAFLRRRETERALGRAPKDTVEDLVRRLGGRAP